MAASAFLGDILAETAKLAAPFAPFIAEQVYRGVTGGASVHLENFPEADTALQDRKLEEEMAEVRSVVAAGLAARKQTGFPIRQPFVSGASASAVAQLARFKELMISELNIKDIRPIEDAKDTWVFAGEGITKFAVDPALTPALEAEGWVREFIRLVQGLRKDAKLTPKDRIVLRWHTSTPLSTSGHDGAVEKAIEAAMSEIETAVRAERVERGPKRTREQNAAEREMTLSGETLWVGIRKKQ